MTFRRALFAIAATWLLSAQSAAAQGNCTRSGNGVCAVGGTATYGLTLTITKVARLVLSANPLALPTPDAVQFDNGTGTSAALGIIVQSNTPWSFAVAANQAFWTAGVGGRVNKPAADLQYSFVLNGTYTDMTTGDVTLQSGSATAGTNYTLYLRVKYNWNLDTPALYSLPVRVVLSAP